MAAPAGPRQEEIEMTSPRIRRAVLALALAAVLGIGAPAHAAGWSSWTASSGWLDNALEWIARLWTGGGAGQRPEPAGVKAEQGNGIDPNGSTSTPQPPAPTTNSDYGSGVAPNG
jgi:hypothetical protein